MSYVCILVKVTVPLLAMQRLHIEQTRKMYLWFEETVQKLGGHSEGARERLTASAILCEASLEGLLNGLDRVEASIDKFHKHGEKA